jgi:hypothetical protein
MIYTAYAQYFATGEGMTHMVMFTRGYGPSANPLENVRKGFSDKFGAYYAMGVEIYEGIKYDLSGMELLISDKMCGALEDWQKDAGGLEYSSSIHVNFS